MSHPKPDPTPQLSHDEIKGLIERGDSPAVLAQLRRAERKKGAMRQSRQPDAKERERSATHSTNLAMDYLSPNLELADSVRGGGRKGAERTHGTPQERASLDRQRVEYYVAQKSSRGIDGKIKTDKNIARKSPDHLRLSERTISRLRREHPELRSLPVTG